MGSKLNRSKTKIYGIGNWKTRDDWPINEFHLEREYLFTLGIYYINDYNKCVDKNWNEITGKIKKHSNMLLNRRLTLQQRVTYANACILSKMWYTAHIYPLTEKHTKEVNTILFKYIWGGRYEPIRRATVHRPIKEGGLAIVNCLHKASTVMVSTFIKCYVHDEYRNSLMFYFCYLRLNNILPSDYNVHNDSPVTTPYYDKVINVAKSILHLPGFPYTVNKNIYFNMLKREEYLAESLYPTFNWKRIWNNHQNTFIYSHDREVIFKHLHMCLATNKKLYVMNLVNSSVCNKCISGNEQTALHMFYQCDYVKPLFLWILRCLLYLCNFKPSSNIKFLYFDNIYNNSYQKNVCNIFIYIYIITIWRNRKENLRIGNLKWFVIRKLSEYCEIIKYMPNHKFETLSKDLSSLDIDHLSNL